MDQVFPWLFPAVAFLFGAVSGSFLNVCIYRIPEGQSVVTPRSRCACGTPIGWYDNIPILSWLLLRGRARCCGRAFSVRYPFVELLTAVLFLVVWIQHPPAVALAGWLFVAVIICATFIDLDHMIIPDRFSIGGMLLGVALAIAVPGLHGVDAVPVLAHIKSGLLAIIGVLVGSGLVYWIGVLGEIVFRKPAMGEGDVKFIAFIGAFCGWQGALFALFGGACIGSLALLPVLLAQRLRRKEPAPQGGSSAEAGSEQGNAEEDAVHWGAEVPFGPLLALGGLIYFLGGERFVDVYIMDIASRLF
ncbi:MAG: prepilin peptidase [Opitutales bacterium]